ncbi:flavodoxin domain-containing protein [Candidatus Frankia alpina]|uniref:Flavodoxin domain-containing protein n=1 Tax=Candidatus Frankia alpina TaxID=2699483 RepID=A0A4S5EPZ8_9ACTN|nr:flavodoxin domain-containing protein [Candidatus Frankia alpina]THJ74183.1 hypothetical protein E7Y31_13005 [Candidatus Frankia alpina]
MTRALVAFGTGGGGADELAAVIGAALTARGLDTEVLPARQVREVASYDAVIVAGALDADRWARDACRFVHRRRAGLSRLPVWLVTGDPWAGDPYAGDPRVGGTEPAQPTAQVAELATLIGARGTVTIDGPPGADGGDGPSGATTWALVGPGRHPEQLTAFVDTVVAAVPPRVLRAVPAWGTGSGEGNGRCGHRPVRMRLVGADPRSGAPQAQIPASARSTEVG